MKLQCSLNQYFCQNHDQILIFFIYLKGMDYKAMNIISGVEISSCLIVKIVRLYLFRPTGYGRSPPKFHLY